MVAKKKKKKSAAPKKATHKKSALKTKQAAKKHAPKKQAAKHKPAAKKKKAPKPKPAAKPKPKAKGAGAHHVRTKVLEVFRHIYGKNKTDEQVLAFDPNDVDALDPSLFYQVLGEIFGVETDPANDYFGGFGGNVGNTIAFIEGRWDGTTLREAPLPPGDFMDDVGDE